MTTRDLIMAASGAAEEKLYADDVFSSFGYIGDDVPIRIAVNNGINLSQSTTTEWNVYSFNEDRGGSYKPTYTKFVTDGTNVYGMGTVIQNHGILTKFDANFNPVWSYLFRDSTQVMYPQDIAIDSSGNIIISGYNTQGIGGLQTFLAKFDSSGTLLWSKSVGSTSIATDNDRSSKVVVDSSGNIFIDSIKVDDGGGFSYLYILKFNSAGTHQWTRRLSDADNLLSFASTNRHLCLDSSGNLYVAASSNNKEFFAKYNTSGVVQWRVQVTSSWGAPQTKRLLFDSTSNSILVVASDPTFSSSTQHLYKLDPSNGTTISATKRLDLGGAIDAILDSNGDVYVTTGAANTGTVRLGEVYLTKYNNSLTPQWAKRFRTYRLAESTIPVFKTMILGSKICINVIGSDYYNRGGNYLPYADNSTAYIISVSKAGTESAGSAGDFILSPATYTDVSASYSTTSVTTTNLVDDANAVTVSTGGITRTNYVEDIITRDVYTQPAILTTGSGLVWIKNAVNTGAINASHALLDTVRSTGSQVALATDSTGTGTGGNNIEFLGSGFRVATNNDQLNETTSSSRFISWTFKEARKFFDIVTYTGNGTSQSITHNLGIEPGFILFKNLTATGNWFIYHRSFTPAGQAYSTLGSTMGIQTSTTFFNNTVPTSSNFTVGSTGPNINGNEYIAYIWAHDSSADSIIQCGSYTGNGTTAFNSINLGWEPQWVSLLSLSGAFGSGWKIYDAARPMPAGINDTISINRAESVYANTSARADYSEVVSPNATGFQLYGANFNAAATTYYYVAIRKQLKKAITSAREVYDSIIYKSAGAVKVRTDLINYDACLITDTNSTSLSPVMFSNYNFNHSTGAAGAVYLGSTDAYSTNIGRIQRLLSDRFWATTTPYIGTDTGLPFQATFFKRAEGFFDIVGLNENNTTNRASIQHSLKAVPAFMIFANRYDLGNKIVYHKDLGVSQYLTLNTDAIPTTSTNYWGTVSDSVITAFPNNADTSIMYIFGEVAGISKAGSYTGNGTNQVINCGFAGVSFLIIKRTDAAGDWWLFNANNIYGITNSNEYGTKINTGLTSLNNYIDQDVSGFRVYQNTNMNVSGATYIYFAIA